MCNLSDLPLGLVPRCGRLAAAYKVVLFAAGFALWDDHTVAVVIGVRPWVAGLPDSADFGVDSGVIVGCLNLLQLFA